MPSKKREEKRKKRQPYVSTKEKMQQWKKDRPKGRRGPTGLGGSVTNRPGPTGLGGSTTSRPGPTGIRKARDKKLAEKKAFEKRTKKRLKKLFRGGGL